MDDDQEEKLFAEASPALIAAAHARAAERGFSGTKAAGFVRGFITSWLAERQRIRTIVTSEHAEHRQALAAHLAFATHIDANEAIQALRVSPADAS